MDSQLVNISNRCAEDQQRHALCDTAIATFVSSDMDNCALRQPNGEQNLSSPILATWVGVMSKAASSDEREGVGCP
jgi:hypothetical protein